MWRNQGSARARRVPCRQVLRGLERLELRCVLSAGSLGPSYDMTPHAQADRPPAVMPADELAAHDAYINGLGGASSLTPPVMNNYGRVAEHSAPPMSTSPSTDLYHSSEVIGADYGSGMLMLLIVSQHVSRAGDGMSAGGYYSPPPSVGHNVATGPSMEPAYAGPDQSEIPPSHGPTHGMIGMPTDASGATHGDTNVAHSTTQIGGMQTTPTVQVAGPTTSVQSAVVANAALGSTIAHTRSGVTGTIDPLAEAAGGSDAAAVKPQLQVVTPAQTAGAATVVPSPISVELAVAGAEISPANFVMNLLEGKASLADIPVSLKGVEHALQSAMSDLERLGAKVTNWVEENQVALIAATVTTVAAGAGVMYYLRRRSRPQAEERDDETSSNWLFVRLQTTLGDA